MLPGMVTGRKDDCLCTIREQGIWNLSGVGDARGTNSGGCARTEHFRDAERRRAEIGHGGRDAGTRRIVLVTGRKRDCLQRRSEPLLAFDPEFLRTPADPAAATFEGLGSELFRGWREGALRAQPRIGHAGGNPFCACCWRRSDSHRLRACKNPGAAAVVG